jgi:hypothetical protein
MDVAANNWARDQGNPRQFRFLKTDYAKIEAEFLELERSDASEQVIKAWADKKHLTTMKLVSEAIELDTWCKHNIYIRQMTEAHDLKQARVDFFVARAQEMTPPMEADLLWKMADFKKILKVRAQPTKRSWDALKAKIEPYIPHAQQVLEYERVMDGYTENLPQIKLYQQLHEHRHTRTSREQQWVLKFASLELKRCVANKVADEDLLLLCLKNIFDKYNEIEHPPEGLRFDGTRGPYRLSLDDARMIVEEIFEKAIPPTTPRGMIVHQSLRCRGCRRSDHVTTYSFTDAFSHILNKHANEVGEGLEYYQFAQPWPRGYTSWITAEGNSIDLFKVKFPWYTMFWPRSLPLVPRHREPAKMEDWHPAVPTEYVRVETPPAESAFAGRSPCATGNPEDAFGLNLVFAAQRIYGVDLDGPCQLKIALKFALDLYSKKHKSEPQVSKFIECLDNIRAVNTKIDLKFGCGICVADNKVNLVTGRSKYRKYLEQLEKHWVAKHHGGPVSWTVGLMQLPSEQEVLQQIISSDKKLLADQEALRERELTRVHDIKKRASLKASVILQQRTAREAFDELFPKVEEA